MCESSPFTASTLKLSALIVGINRYKHNEIPDLRGAVNDAQAMKQYLLKELGVPNDRIIYLENKKATREGIINAFNKLKKLPGLVRGSPVLIYLAGHGTRVHVDDDTMEEVEADDWTMIGRDTNGQMEADDWTMISRDTKDQMEAFVPYDCDGLWKGSIHPILDKTVSCLIESIYKDFGDNIVMILDCCHSGSMTRGISKDPQLNVRRLASPASYRYPMKIDLKLISELLPDGSEVASPSTHVLLAACGAQELAKENELDGKCHGDFTRALLTLFQSTPIGRLTPADVPIRLKKDIITEQNPQCVGDNRMRYFFCGESSTLIWYRVTYDFSGDLQVNGGSLHGISKGATFKVFGDRDLNKFVGIAKVATLKPFTSTLKPANEWDVRAQPGFALLHDVGDFVKPRVFITEKARTNDGQRSKISRALESLSKLDHQIYPIRGKPKDSCFSLTEQDDGAIYVATLDPRLSFHDTPDIHPIPIQPDADEIRKVLARAAQFFHHLDTGSSDDHRPTQIDVSIMEIGDVFKETHGDAVRVTVARRHLVSEVPLEDGRLFVTDMQNTDKRHRTRRALHGLRIKNNSDRSWFFSILWFDGVDYTISRMYCCSSASEYKTDPCILPNSERKLGFGSGSKDFCLAPHISDKKRQREFGVLKFIFTSVPVDFATVCSTKSLPAVSSRGMTTHELPEVARGEWATLCIPVVITMGKEGDF